MLPFIQSIVNQFIKLDKCTVDSAISKLHYVATTVILVVFSVVVTSKGITSGSISCHSRIDVSGGPSEQQLNSFCLGGDTYSVSQETTITDSDTFRGNTTSIPLIYQYQPILFCLLAIIFYAPKLIWHLIENCQIEKIVNNLGEPLQECLTFKSVISFTMNIINPSPLV